MKEKIKIKRKIIFLLIAAAIISAPLNVTWGLYFGVLANLMINAFWNSKLFPEKKKTNRELIIESIEPRESPRLFADLPGQKKPIID